MIGIPLALRLTLRTRSRTRQCRSRRAVASLAGAWLIAMVAFNVFLHDVRPDWNHPRLAARHNQLRREIQHAGEARVAVILGSSRSLFGMSPTALAGPDRIVVNYSSAGAGPHRHLLELHRLLESGLRPDAVLIEILPIHMGLASKDSPEVELGHGPAEFSRSDWFAFGPYWQQPLGSTANWAEARLLIASRHRIRILARTAPWLLTREQIDMNRPDPPAQLGWSPFNHPNITENERARRFAAAEKEYRDVLHRFAINPDIARIYRDLIGRCRARGIAVAFYFMPESPRFRQWTSANTKHSILAFVQFLAAETGTAVFDATDWIDREWDFCDGHHLLMHGAVPFSERFGRECLGPWLATLPPVVR